MRSVPKVLIVLGTRPEAIKLSPLIVELKKNHALKTLVCVLQQQPKLVLQSLSLFGVTPDFKVLFPFGDAGILSSSIFKKVRGGIAVVWGFFSFFRFLRKERPDLVIVQGDTSTAVFVALLAFHLKISVAHVEAGLRTNNKYSPFPEEINRRIISVIADIHFSPTEKAKENLLREGVPEASIVVTGNTVIDAVRHIAEQRQNAEEEKVIDRFFRDTCGFDCSDSDKKMVFFTTHRRESFGDEMKFIMQAVKMIAEAHKDVFIVYPMHSNPNVIKVANEILYNVPQIVFIDSMRYDRYVYLLKKAHFIITDSGGLQEEISYFGKPTIVVRNVTERPEGIAGGNLILAGTKTEDIFNHATRLINDPEFYRSVSKKHSAFGDGNASTRIIATIEDYLK